MPKLIHCFFLATICILVATGTPHVSVLEAQSTQSYTLALPIIVSDPRVINRSLFGFDIDPQSSATALSLAQAAQPHLARSGDILWGDLEPERGTPYRWEQLGGLEQRLHALHSIGSEPVVVVQGAPSWARLYPDYPCSPINPAFFGDFANFMHALAERYHYGPMSVRYWEIWNEPDFYRDSVQANGGYGCWAEPGQPFSGGDRFGAMLNAVYGPIKQANPDAQVIAGSLSHIFPDAQYNDFLDGILASGAGNAFDILGFHAYSDWRYEDLLVRKTAFARATLARYGFGDRPLLLTEVAALCVQSGCSPEPTPALRLQQANQVARINAEIAALRLAGALWYPLAAEPPGFSQGQLINVINGQDQPLPAYYAMRNSALLLLDAQATETSPRELQINEWGMVQVMRFLKPTTTLYVLWVQQTDHAVRYDLRVPDGAKATCWERLDKDSPTVTDCTDRDTNGKIPRSVDESPQYIEVAR